MSATFVQDYTGLLMEREQLAETAGASRLLPRSRGPSPFDRPTGCCSRRFVRSLLASLRFLTAMGSRSGLQRPGRVQVFLRPTAQAPSGSGAGSDGLLILDRVGLLSIDQAATPPTVRMKPVIQAASGATPKNCSIMRPEQLRTPCMRCGRRMSSGAWLAADLRSCAASLQEAAGDLLWAGGCHPLLLRAGRSRWRAPGRLGPSRTGGTRRVSPESACAEHPTPLRSSGDWPTHT